MWLGGTAVAGAVLARWQLARWFTEQPRYVRERKVDGLEIRCYAPHWVAETRVQAPWEEALQEGFRRLASYISGSHQLPPSRAAAVADPDEPVESTAPTVRRQPEPIAMTAPVQLQRSAPLSELPVKPEDPASHVVTFHLPRGRAAANLPAPEDPRVQLSYKPETRVAVLRYRGAHDALTMASRSLELLVALRRAGLRYRGNPQFAGYDPPSTLPLLRRNEVWVELEAS